MTYHSNKDLLIKELLQTIKETQHRYQSENDEEKQWLLQNSPNQAVAEAMKEMTTMSLHLLDTIGLLEPVNGVSIAKQMGISKGSVSKITKKLIEKQLIMVEYLPNNKKEVLFRMTPLGRDIYHLHQALHQQIDTEIHRFMQQFEENELQVLVKIAHEALLKSWIHPGKDAMSNADSGEVSNMEQQESYTSVRPSSDSEEMSEIIEVLRKLDSRNLKKAKTILIDIFVTEY